MTDDEIRIAVSQALVYGTKFLVNEHGVIQVRNPERMPPNVRSLLRSRWRDASREILAREAIIRQAEPEHCARCGAEIARWVGGNLWLPGYMAGWGEDGWANMGRAIPEIRCRECGSTWRPKYAPGRDPRLR